MGEILDAIQDANKEIHTKYEWPWTRGEANIPIQPTYTTGSLSINDGSASFTGLGTTWSTGWTNKRILLGNIDYLVSAFTSPTTGTLVQPINVGANKVNVPYTVFQDTYALPTDCEFGGILLVINPTYRYRLRYFPVYTAEWTSAYTRTFFNNFQSGFSDAGVDDATGASLIRFTPAPGSVAEYRIVYRRRPPALSALTSISMIPESFDRVIELMAEYMVRFHRKQPMAGWMEVKNEAYQLLQAMRRKMAITMTDTYQTYATFGADRGRATWDAGVAFIGPTTGTYP